MIILDPTECRIGTMLPESIVKAGVSVPGFEQYTGADLLITTLDKPKPTSITDSIPSQTALHKLCDAGVLIQRKSGRDVTNLISSHNHILAKMLKYTSSPRLLITGSFTCNDDGKLIINGQESNYDYYSFQGTLDAWQEAGGFISILSRDSLVTSWCGYVLKHLKEPTKDKVILPRKPQRNIIVAGEEDDETMQCVNGLSIIPGIGSELAVRIAKYCGTFANALVFLSDPSHLRMKRTEELWPKGVGPSHFSSTRHLLGLKSDDYDSKQWLEVMLVGLVYPSKKEGSDVLESAGEDSEE